MRRHAWQNGWATAAAVAGTLVLGMAGANPSVAARPSRTTLAFAASSSTGGANHFLLRRAGRYIQIVDVDTHRVLRERLFASTAAVSIDGANGPADNTLTVEFSRGSLAVPGGIAFDGGRGGYNTLALHGGRFARQQNTATGPHSGLLVLDGTRIRYSDIAPINDLTPTAEYTLNVAAESINVNVIDGPNLGGTQTTQLNDGGSSSFELANVANKARITVNVLSGRDTLIVNNPNPAQGLTEITLGGVERESTEFDVLATAVPLNIIGRSADTANVGMGKLAGILAPVTVTDPLNFIALNVDDSADPTGRTASITTDGTADTVSGLGPSVVTAPAIDLSSLAVSA